MPSCPQSQTTRSIKQTAKVEVNHVLSPCRPRRLTCVRHGDAPPLSPLPVGARALYGVPLAAQDQLRVVKGHEARAMSDADNREPRQGVQQAEHPLLVSEILGRQNHDVAQNIA